MGRENSDNSKKVHLDNTGTRKVDADEAGMRLDRWFKLHYSGLAFGQLQKLLRSGQIRINSGRVKSDTRIATGQLIRIPPMLNRLGNQDSGKFGKHLTSNTIRDRHDVDVLQAMLLHEDDKVFVFDKPAGLAVQGGSGLNRHIDKMLESMRSKKGEKPRLVHRLDRETSGVLVVAKTRGAAAALTKSFRHRETRKTYWAICKGVPRKKQGGISEYMVKEHTADGDRMRIARHGERGADHSQTNYRVVEQSGQNLSWLELQPISGRTHQLRVHTAHIGFPIIGDSKYFNIENWALPGGIQNRLHLHARNIKIPHPSGGILDITAPLPQHMVQTFNLLGFEEASAEEKEEL
ncbi:MAG: RluA family pseudouridine synthase [Hyphomicrobiales bacterium]|nr:RluA family pseudouridine synthase [Hyphomicrobiales bacterium]